MAKDLIAGHLDSLKKRLFDEMASGLVLRDRSNRIVWCNTAAERTFGLTLDQLIGRKSLWPDVRVVQPDSTPLPDEERPSEVCMRTGEAARDLIMGVHQRDGTLRWLNVDTFPLRGDGGQLEGIGSIFDDVTAQSPPVRTSPGHRSGWPSSWTA